MKTSSCSAPPPALDPFLPEDPAPSDTDSIALKYGKPFFLNRDSIPTALNERYWAARYMLQHRILHDPGEESFYVYLPNRGLWRHESANHIRETISENIFLSSKLLEDPRLEKLISFSKTNSIVSMLAGMAERRDAFTNKARYIHCSNGVVRLENRNIAFGNFSPDDYSLNQSPYPYIPGATCPRFINELILPALDPEDASLLQRWVGLALYGYNLPQRFLIIDGMPNGGKGTLVRVAQALVGIENTCQLRTDQLLNRFELHRFLGRSLLIGPDAPGNFLENKSTSVLKTLVGGDPLSPEGKNNSHPFSMFGTFNVVITANSRLRVRLDEDSGAWRRRMLSIRYEKPPVANRILDFDKILLAEEGPGILQWALQGFINLQEEFAAIGDFNLTPAQLGRVDSLLNESNSLRLFIRDQLEENEFSEVSVADLQDAYVHFCLDHGWNALPISEFEKLSPDIILDTWRVLRSNDIKQTTGRAARGYHGLHIKRSNGS